MNEEINFREADADLITTDTVHALQRLGYRVMFGFQEQRPIRPVDLINEAKNGEVQG